MVNIISKKRKAQREMRKKEKRKARLERRKEVKVNSPVSTSEG
jgi:hypothetical protein